MENKKEFQFVKSSRLGQRVFLDKTELDEKSGDIMLIFTDGTRAKESQLGSSLIEIPKGHPGYEFKKQIITDLREEKDIDGKIQMIPGPDHGKITWIKRKLKVNPEDKQIKNPIEKPEVQLNQKEPLKTQENPFFTNVNSIDNDNAVLNLLSKAKKVDRIFKIDVNIESIDKNLFDVISENYDDGADKIIEFLIRSINFDDLKKELTKKIKQSYGSKKSKGGVAIQQ